MDIKTILNSFKDKLQHPSSYRLLNRINYFLDRELESTSDRKQLSKIMNEFIASVEKSLPSYDCWKGANETEVESNSEALEYLITKKKYRKLFGNEAKDIQLDSQLQEAYEKFSFIRPEHIEIDPRYSEESSLSVAIDQLRKINDFTAPRDKLIMISNCCRVVNCNGYIVIISRNSGKSYHGAEDSFPLFVYVVLRSRAEKLFSNCSYIKYYRFITRKLERDPVEFRYNLAVLKSAVKFITILDESKIKLQPGEDYNQLISQNGKVSRAVQTSPEPGPKAEVELISFENDYKYAGPISVEHFLNNPVDLQRFIDHYYSLTRSANQNA